jgi:hypothetical protein
LALLAETRAWLRHCGLSQGASYANVLMKLCCDGGMRCRSELRHEGALIMM